MALATYSDLTALVQSILNRTDADTISNISNFVRYAHDEIVRTLRLPLTVTALTTFSITGERVLLPADFRSVIDIELVGYPPGCIGITDPATRARMANYWIAQGQPRLMAVENTYAAFAPVPDAVYPAVLIYQASPLVMSQPTDTNAIFAQNPYLYVHGAAAEGFRYNSFSDAATDRQTMFEEMLERVRVQGLKDATAGRLEPMPSILCAP